MTKREFIIECSMRNMQAAISASGTRTCSDSQVIKRCYYIAQDLAKLLYE